MLQTVGFQAVQSLALDVLVDVLERYIVLLSRTSHDYCELANRTEPTLDDIAAAFHKHRVDVGELEEFVKWVDTPEFALAKHANIVPEAVAPSISTINTNASTTTTTTTAGMTVSKQRDKSYWDLLGAPSRATGAQREAAEAELAERQSDDEFEHVYEHLPLMRPPRVDETTTTTTSQYPTAASAAAGDAASATDIVVASATTSVDESGAAAASVKTETSTEATQLADGESTTVEATEQQQQTPLVFVKVNGVK